MVRIIECGYIFTPQGYIKDKAVAFDENILEIGDGDLLRKRFPHSESIRTSENEILYPGFINTHVHLEFSANRTDLAYGDFMKWLYSVIEKRDMLINKADNETMAHACREMLSSGVTCFGAVSTYGKELDVCRDTPQRVVFFNELVGSNPAMADALYDDFEQRVRHSSEYKKDNITPAVAIHSPYSVHPVLLRKAVALAKEERMALSTHFMESKYEREWLDRSSGGFLDFFKNFFRSESPVNSPEEFLESFDGYRSLLVHCVHMNEKEKNHIVSQGHTIAHCPRSNTLLGCGKLDLDTEKIPVCVATDGLSSNWSLNIFDELRAALMMHTDKYQPAFASKLLRGVTKEAADALRLANGRIAPGAPADMVSISLPGPCENEDDLALQTIIHTKKVKRVWIGGSPVSV